MLVGWKYRKKIIISGSSGAGTGYQVLLKVGESSGASGCDFHVDGLSANFPSDKNQSGDLRFTDNDGETLLPFWVEKVEGSSPNRVAYCWVKVADNLDSSQDIWIYYGNASASNVSNGDDTFDFFDDFDDGIIDAKWTTNDSNWVEQNGYILVNTNDWITDELHAKNLSINLPFIIETRGLVHNTSSDLQVSLIFSDDSTQDMHWVTTSPDKYSNFFGSKMDWVMSLDVWYNFIVKPVKNGEQKWYLDGTLKTPQTSVSLPSSIKEIKLRGKGYARWDFIRLRKYTDPEPSFSSAGATESVGNAIFMGVNF